MGYTHYWRRKPSGIFNDNDWAKYVESMQALFDVAAERGLNLVGPDDSEEPYAYKGEVLFNAAPPDGYEDFYMAQEDFPYVVDDDGLSFHFCKTRKSEYDQVVVAALLAAKICFGDDIVLDSDGDIANESHADGVLLLEQTEQFNSNGIYQAAEHMFG